MKKVLLLASAACMLWSCEESIDHISNRVFDLAVEQCIMMDGQLTDTTMPRSYTQQGIFLPSNLSWWCSGFFPGTLWYVYEWTGNEQIKALAEKNTVKIADVDACQSAHDLGFQYWCSYGNAWRITGDSSYLPTVEYASAMLARRYNPTVGCIRSWGDVNDKTNYKVIIDNMMNLEMLMEAAKLFNCDSLSAIATTHANTTMANHFRENNTSYHVLEYDQETGLCRNKITAQGYSDESAWARGQAWGLYGYTMMYRECGNEEYLAMAEKIAKVVLPMLPEDGIPYWDFDCPAIPYTCRDASAGAIMCSALIDLSTFTSDKALAKKCIKMAEKQIRSLASPEYLAMPGTNGGFLLRHSTGNLHGNERNPIREVDAPLTYADYYFLEALLKYKAI